MVIRYKPHWMRLRRSLDSSYAALIHPVLYDCWADYHIWEDDDAFDV